MKKAMSRNQEKLLRRNIEWYEASEEQREKLILKAWASAIKQDRNLLTEEEYIEREIRYRIEEWERYDERGRGILLDIAHYEAVKEDEERDGMSESEWQERIRLAEKSWAEHERKDQEFVDKFEKGWRVEELAKRGAL